MTRILAALMISGTLACCGADGAPQAPNNAADVVLTPPGTKEAGGPYIINEGVF